MKKRCFLSNKNNEKGITLTALILTILLLILLTGITIGYSSSGLEAKNSMKNEVTKYNSVMQEQLDDLDNMKIDKDN